MTKLDKDGLDLLTDTQAHGRLMGLPLRSGLSAALIAP
ncbi:hypothetical protein C8N34_13810 [Gemmobacter caeni]|uniref:Uncharacterized protein n=1 Tax=Gemmobacter caeni TaxID=589035 RepID=A0A2T6A6E7_9RHOB|nr:hypothetical protein C8N34_13810 [Gemmobacter caeni]